MVKAGLGDATPQRASRLAVCPRLCSELPKKLLISIVRILRPLDTECGPDLVRIPEVLIEGWTGCSRVRVSQRGGEEWSSLPPWSIFNCVFKGRFGLSRRDLFTASRKDVFSRLLTPTDPAGIAYWVHPTFVFMSVVVQSRCNSNFTWQANHSPFGLTPVLVPGLCPCTVE